IENMEENIQDHSHQNHKKGEKRKTNQQPEKVSLFSNIEDFMDESDLSDEYDDEEMMGEDEIKFLKQTASDPEFLTLLQQMDNELENSAMASSFERPQHKPNKTNRSVETATSDEDEQATPVDIDFNLVKNLLDSYSAQGGNPG